MKHSARGMALVLLTLWAVAAYPAHLLAGGPAVVYGLTAVVLCLIPTAILQRWRQWALAQSPDQQLLVLLAGTGLRMAVVLGAGAALYASLTYFQQPSFWIWILVFYLTTLALELRALLTSSAPRERPA